MTAQSVTDGDFEQEVLKSDKPVVVDFWAPWCGPCKAMSPLVDELASEVGEDVKVTKVNIDDNPNAPTQSQQECSVPHRHRGERCHRSGAGIG